MASPRLQGRDEGRDLAGCGFAVLYGTQLAGGQCTCPQALQPLLVSTQNQHHTTKQHNCRTCTPLDHSSPPPELRHDAGAAGHGRQVLACQRSIKPRHHPATVRRLHTAPHPINRHMHCCHGLHMRWQCWRWHADHQPGWACPTCYPVHCGTAPAAPPHSPACPGASGSWESSGAGTLGWARTAARSGQGQACGW